MMRSQIWSLQCGNGPCATMPPRAKRRHIVNGLCLFEHVVYFGRMWSDNAVSAITLAILGGGALAFLGSTSMTLSNSEA